MKTFAEFAAMVLFMVIASSSVHAYTVYIQNNTDNNAEVRIYGEHVFWKQVDCTVTVGPKMNGRCDMPALICTTSAEIVMTYKNTRYRFAPPDANWYGFPRCRDTGIYIWINSGDDAPRGVWNQ